MKIKYFINLYTILVLIVLMIFFLYMREFFLRCIIEEYISESAREKAYNCYIAKKKDFIFIYNDDTPYAIELFLYPHGFKYYRNLHESIFKKKMDTLFGYSHGRTNSFQ